MKVFISWSGTQSRAIADSIRKWLPGVLQAVKPYFSPDDVAKGARWNSEIGKELEASSVGVLVVTRENLAAPWLMFEAGALAKNLDTSKVCPLLFGLDATDLTGPLVQFQGARFEQAEMKRVVKMINAELGDSALSGDVLDQVFEMWWPTLEEEVAALLAGPAVGEGALRSERDMLEEVLSLTRRLSREPRRMELGHPAFDDLAEAYAALLTAAEIDGLPPAATRALGALERPVRYVVARYSRVGRGRAALEELEKAGILQAPERTHPRDVQAT